VGWGSICMARVLRVAEDCDPYRWEGSRWVGGNSAGG